MLDAVQSKTADHDSQMVQRRRVEEAQRFKPTHRDIAAAAVPKMDGQQLDGRNDRRGRISGLRQLCNN